MLKRNCRFRQNRPDEKSAMITEGEVLLAAAILVVLFGFLESAVLRRNLSRIPVRIHVNGTRGKSSVTRLIAGGLREQGMVTCAKTTGTLPRMILPDGSEYPVFRPGGAKLIEQTRIASVAAAYGAQALVVECMALQPKYQWLCESRLVKSTHGVITNAREDHLDVMGPQERDVALALAGTIPIKGSVYTTEKRNIEVFREAARDRKAAVVAVGQDEIDSVTDEEMSRFSYLEHKDNVALSLRVCRDLGVDRDTALRGMWKTIPDAGATFISHIRFFGRHIYFVNGFAANDPESTQQVWDKAVERFPGVEKRIAIFNCREDRPTRSQQFGRVCMKWQPADRYILIGTGTYFFAREAISAGLPSGKLVFAEHRTDPDLFETILELAGSSCLVVGMANIKGQGLSLVRFFKNRAIMKDKM